jgi:hypothetical protein
MTLLPRHELDPALFDTRLNRDVVLDDPHLNKPLGLSQNSRNPFRSSRKARIATAR